MKIKICNYDDGEARVVFEEYPNQTFRVPITDKITKEEVISILKLQLAKQIVPIKKDKFDELKLKELEGSEL